MLLNYHSPDNVHQTIVRQPLTVHSKMRLLDVIALINEAQANFRDVPSKNNSSSNNFTKDINNIASQVASCVLVVDDSQLVGILTQRDLIKMAAERKNLEGISVAEVMTTELVTLKIEDFKDVFTALNLLRQHRICHLPIIGNQGELIGLVTPTSLLAVTIQQAGLYNYARVKLAERQRIEAELRLERNFISTIFNLTDALVVVLDSQGRIVRFNQTCEQATGYAFEAAQGKYVWNVLRLPDITECLKDIFQNLAAREFPQRYEAILINQDGDRRLISWSNKVLLNHDDQIHYIVCTGIDITESRQAQEELRQAKEQLQTVLDAVPGFVSWVSADGYYLGVNRHLAESFNLTADNFVGQELGFLQNSPQFTEFMHDFLHRQDVADSSVVDTQINGFTRKYLVIAQKYQQNTAAVAVGIDITERKQAEMALAESEAMLRSVLKSTPSMVRVINTEGEISFINQTTPHLSWEEVVGTSIDDYVLQEDCEIQRSALEKVFAQGEVVSYETRALDKQTKLKYYHSQIGPIWHNQQVTGAVIITNDITDRKQTEIALQRAQEALQQLNRDLEARVEQRTLALQESEAELRAIFNQAAVGIKLETLDGQLLKVNQKLCELLGYSQAELMSKTFRDLTYADDIPHHQKNLEKLISGEIETFSIEKRCLHKNGHQIWINLTVSLIRDVVGKPLYSVGIVKDIRNQKQAEEDLKRQFAAVEAAIDGIAILSGNVYTYLNQAHVKMFGYTKPEELIGKSWSEIYEPQEIQRFQNEIFPTLMQQKHWRGETIAKRKNGSYFAEEVSLTISEQGDLICVCRDISDRKKAEADICKALAKEKELSELKSRFISMTSHEFRTPLAVIASSAGILKSFSHKLDEQQKQKHLQCIQTYVQHTTQLLDDILLINKAEAGKLAFEPNYLDLVNFCHTLVEEIQLSSPEHHLVFCHPPQNSQLDGEPIMAYMDKKLLRQILSNLLSNAVKYSPNNSRIQIDLLIQNQNAVFLIQDEGIGVSPEEQQNLFEPFFRASNVGNIPGTGLGLAIVHKCVDLHQGRITIASQVGFGTTFRVELPLVVKSIN
ncbi:PAS domain S-box protein [Nostoc spongiaeforme FACHB-130]|uniref:histidine kinase n=1 Tax=Nostoc spongiaeforme FACHB-130 TaxID=1357510 RepID=A0ABR8FSH5_9NOSO|nr:PAS domain S-box protein [Nostoc spongiaeforme]MBD2594390.1 PAS domain S-box protein [Nostoc spongiaeforme FACHB-130]